MSDTRPLYATKTEPKLDNGHVGLFFDKFCPTLDKKPQNGEDAPKFKWVKDVAKSAVGDAALISEFIVRRKQLIGKLHGLSLSITTAERFVTGLGYRHPLENGFAWHSILGTPYVPGSGLKGLARAYATFLGVEPEEMNRIFGPRSKNGQTFEPKVGSVVFLEAIPTGRVKLVAEVMTPHYGPYYRDGAAPGDYHAPVPIPFLAVEKGIGFLAGVLPRRPNDEDDRKDAARARDWLCEALKEFGAGAKTATGYGRFDVEAAVVLPLPTVLPAVIEVEFVDFADARKARKKARERAREGKAPKRSLLAVRPMDPALMGLAKDLMVSIDDTEGFELPFERAAQENASRPFYVGDVEERDGTKVAGTIWLTGPVT